MTDLAALSSLLTSYNPRFANADYGPVVRWLSEGASLEHDVIPVVRFWTGRKKDIYSLRFFTSYVMKARDARLERERPSASADDRTKAARIAFATRVVGIRDPRKEAWLERYEAEHGGVAV